MNIKNEDGDITSFPEGTEVEDEKEDSETKVEAAARLRASIAEFAFAGPSSASQLRRSPRKARTILKAETPSEILLRTPPSSPSKRKLRSELPKELVDSAPVTPIPFKLDLSPGKAGRSFSSSPSPTKKVKRGYAPPETYAHLNGLTDRLADDLDVLFCGINPGKFSAEVGFHYANPTNHFWRCLYLSGFTDRLLQPKEEAILPVTYNIGLTDLVERPSIEQAELSLEEMSDSVPALLSKIQQFHPRIVCFVGKGIWQIFEKGLLKRMKNVGAGRGGDDGFGASPKKISTSSPRKKASGIAANPRVKADINEGYGLQPYQVVHLDRSSQIVKDENANDSTCVHETLFFAMPSTSGRVVSHQLTDKAELFKQVRQHAQEHKDGIIDLSKFQKVPC